MREARIIIDTQAGKIKVEPPLHGSFKKNASRLLRLKKETTIKPREEVQVIGECNSNFDVGLVNGENNPLVHLMDGIVDGKNSSDLTKSFAQNN